MYLFHPHNEEFANLDDFSREIMQKTISFFEKKGKKKIKHDDHERAWYADFLDFVHKEDIFYHLLCPREFGDDNSRYDFNRNCNFNEILGFYGLAYWYTWQVSMLGLGPIWESKNDHIKKQAAKYLKEGGIFAFGLSEKEHGADLISSEMRLSKKDDNSYIASGRKYYIGNANKASLVSTFAKTDQGEYVFFAVKSDHPNYTCVKNTVNSQNYVAEYELNNYPITDDVILTWGREAWDSSLSTIAYCKYNLGWASIGICTHAFYESINHASNRILFKNPVTNFPHIRQFFTDAYVRLVAMRLFARRASDYMRSASDTDKRYLLYNPMVKMKVTMQGEEVINLLWDIIAAKGFEKDMYFEMAARDIRALPKLEGTAQVNMALIIKFIDNFLFAPTEMPEIEPQQQTIDDEFLFRQGSTSKGQNKILFHDYNIALQYFDLPNIKEFAKQVESLKELIKEHKPTKEQSRDLDFMLILGELFTLVPYAQLILEQSKIQKIDPDVINQIFDFLVRDFSRYALQLYSKSGSSKGQMEACLRIIRKPIFDQKCYNRLWDQFIFPIKDSYVLKE